jgi:hypothetical protein
MIGVLMRSPLASTQLLLLGGALLVGCSNLDRSLIFATHTTEGLELSVGAPQSGGSPVQIVLGYKRFEGVINPVYDSEGINAASDKYRAEAYSVIAKFQGEIKAGSGSTTSGHSSSGSLPSGALVTSQWFATGSAATWLAQSTATVAALSDNPEVAKAIGGMDVATRRTLRHLMVSQARQVAPFLRDSSAADPEAKRHLDALNQLGAILPAKYPFDHYRSFDPTADPAIVRERLIGTAVAAANFDDVITYWDQLSDSQANLALIVAASAPGSVKLREEDAGGAGIVNSTPALSDPVFAKDFRLQADLLESFEKQLFNDPAFDQATRYVAGVIKGETGH